jgi:hypothetical protein
MIVVQNQEDTEAHEFNEGESRGAENAKADGFPLRDWFHRLEFLAALHPTRI